MILREPAFKVVRYADTNYRDGSFVLVEPLVFVWEKKRCVVTVSAGIVTNFASIPPGFKNTFPVNGRHRLAAVAHDFLYGCAGIIKVDQFLAPTGEPVATEESFEIYYTRAEADLVFYELMLAEAVKKTKARLMYQAVRWFGHKSWGGE